MGEETVSDPAQSLSLVLFLLSTYKMVLSVACVLGGLGKVRQESWWHGARPIESAQQAEAFISQSPSSPPYREGNEVQTGKTGCHPINGRARFSNS